MSALRVAVRASRLERPAWQAEMIARLRDIPGVELVETYESHLLLPADLLIDPTDIAPLQGGPIHPRLGIWRFVHGSDARISDACVREHAAGERGVMVRLVSLAADGRAIVLETGVFKCAAHSLSATRARVFESIAAWPARALQSALAEPESAANGAAVSISDARDPRALSLPGAFGSAVRNIARRINRELLEEHWAIGIIDKPVHHVIDSFDASAIRWLTPPDNLVLADPVGAVMRDDGRLTILAEAYDFDDRQGRIVALDVQDARIVSPVREVLRLDAHVSYPQLICHGGETYCLPEMAALNRIQLFRAAAFPDRWLPDRILLANVAGADATLCQHGGLWWMFTGDHNDQDEAKLFLFYATDLFGAWQPHARNPVKCDLRASRSAGPLFEHNGELYRPAQDGSATYGGAVALNRIRRLSPTVFDEETVAVLRPARAGPYPDGLHTLTGVGNLTLVDGKRHARSFKRLAWGLKQLARERLRGPVLHHGSAKAH